MNSSYTVETSYSIDVKLKVIIIIAVLIIIAAIIVSLVKLIKTGKIKIGKKNNDEIDDHFATDVEQLENVESLENSYSNDSFDSMIEDTSEGYDAPNFNDDISSKGISNIESTMVMPQMESTSIEQTTVMNQTEDTLTDSSSLQTESFGNENELPRSIWSNNSDINVQ